MKYVDNHKNKKLMQAPKSACRSGKKVVILHRNCESGTRNQESGLICYEDKSDNHNSTSTMLLMYKQDRYREW